MELQMSMHSLHMATLPSGAWMSWTSELERPQKEQYCFEDLAMVGRDGLKCFSEGCRGCHSPSA
jgi:hypothetical protein